MSFIKSLSIIIGLHLLFFINFQSSPVDQSTISLKLKTITSTPNSKNNNKINNDLKHSSSSANEQSIASTKNENNLNQDNYLDLISSIIEDHKYYPTTALKLHLNGVVYINFTIDSFGEVANINIESSTHQILEDTAYDIILKIKKFPNPPEQFTNKKITVPIEFKNE